MRAKGKGKCAPDQTTGGGSYTLPAPASEFEMVQLQDDSRQDRNRVNVQICLALPRRPGHYRKQLLAALRTCGRIHYFPTHSGFPITFAISTDFEFSFPLTATG